MAGGQQIDSGQGSVVQSADVALTGAEVAVQDGTIVANTPADVAATGVEATIASGTTAPSAFAFLRSRKVGGGSASRALTGSAITASPGALLMSAAKTPTGASITSTTGALGRSRTRALTGASATAAPGSMTVSGQTSIFPLSIHSSGRYLATAQGDGFLIHGDTPWSLPAQLTNAEIDTYIADRAARGFTSILIEAIVRTFTSQTPDYRTVDGLDPFTTMTDFSSPNNAYWSRIDYIVNACKAQNMVVFMNPAYLGFNGGSEGWMVQVNAASAASLQAYGVFLANRYTQGNIIWCMGGDYAGTVTERNKQWNIVTGMRTVRTTDIITAHGAPGDQAYTSWTGYTGFNLNNAYPQAADVYTYCLTEYGRAGPVPFFMIEGRYEGEPNPPTTAQRIRLQAYQALLSGACGHFYGNNPIWHFESPNALFPYTGTWESNLNSTGAQDMQRVKTLFDSYQWELLQPKTDTSLVTSALGTGDNRICPARASDASFALIYIPTSTTVTVNMAALTVGSVRARLYNPTTGVYTTVTGSPFTPSGTQNIASGGERVLVLDAEPITSFWTGTTWATNGSPSDVQAKINLASPGDIITLPAGAFTWTSGVTCNKGVHIKGAGGGRIEGASRSSVAIGTGTKTFTLRVAGGKNSWITGFTPGEAIRARSKHDGAYMEGTVTSWSAPTLTLNITSVSGSGTKSTWTFEVIEKTSITHNAPGQDLFAFTENATQYTGLSDLRLIRGTGGASGTGYGVTIGGSGKIVMIWNFRSSRIHQGIRSNNLRGYVRRSYFDAGFNIGADPTNNNNSIQVTNPGGTGWNTAHTMGVLDTTGIRNFYVEDCYFVGLSLGCADWGDYCRSVMRGCVLDNSGMTTHGFDTDPIGVRHTEHYNNMHLWDDAGANTANTNYFGTFRGGSGIVSDNYFDDMGSSAAYGLKSEFWLEVQQIRRGGTICATSYPALRQTGQGHNGTSFITEGVWFFSNTGTLEISPVQYPTDECGNGQVIGTYIQLNRDYFTRAPTGSDLVGAWSPYPYPHPLSNGLTP